jgi:hypothetical protein
VKKAVQSMLAATQIEVKESNFEAGNSTVPRVVANVQKIKNKYRDLQLDWQYKKSTTT